MATQSVKQHGFFEEYKLKNHRVHYQSLSQSLRSCYDQHCHSRSYVVYHFVYIHNFNILDFLHHNDCIILYSNNSIHQKQGRQPQLPYAAPKNI